MDLEIEWDVAAIALILWGIFTGIILFVPKAMELQEYPLSYKIMIPRVLLPES